MKAPKNCSRFQILVFIFQSLSIFIPDSLQAQSIPPNPNKMENGKRQGRWTLLLNEKKSRVDSLQYATYYRLITYQDGKPTGITQDYYLSGKLQMQGKLISEGLVPKYEGIVTYYRPNGKKDYEEKYENGESTGKTYFNLNGSIVKEDWEKLQDEAMKKHFVEGKYEKALELVKKGKQAAKKQFGTVHQHYAICLMNEGNIYVRQKKYTKAEKTLQKALKIMENALGKNHEDYVAALVSIGNIYYHQGKHLKAEPLFQEALQRSKAKYKDSNSSIYALPLNNLATIAIHLGKYKQADTLFTEASQIFEKLSPAAYAIALNNLTSVYYYQARYREADSTALLSLKIQEKEAKDSPYYAQTLSNLSTSYMKQARYTQADSLLALAKGIFEKTGKEHSYYLAYLSNLATTYVSKAKHIQADSLYLAILKIQKKNVGKMHPDYATVLNNLAYSHIYQGKLSQAEAILLEAKAIFEKTKNEEHTIYHTVLTNIGELYRDWGKYKQAEDFFLKAKEMTAKVLGEQHPEYAITLNSLAFLYSLQGKFAQEAPLRLTAIQIAKNTIGEKHPDYATYLSHLAMMYENQGNYAQVDSLYHLVIEIRKNALGENHPDCALDLANLGTYYFNQSNYVKAEALYQKALEIYRNAKNETNRYYLLTLQNLANTYLSQGEYEKSEEILLLILKSTEQSLGKNNDSYAGTLKLLADLYYNQSNYVKVEPMYREALEVLKNIAQEQSPTYLYILSSLANAYSIQKNYTQADSLYVQATQLCKEIYGEKHPEYAQILGMQALFYRKQNLYNKAIPLFEQALAILSKTKGENHADYSNMANQLAIVYDDIYDFDKATPLVLKVAENKLKEIQNNLSNLSESGKQKYLVNKQGFLTNLHGYIAHVLEKNPDYKDLPRLLQTAFTLQLQTKGLLLSETQKVRNRIFASGDSALIRQMELWQAKKNFIAKVYNMPTTERKSKKINLSKLVSEANDLEKNLTTRSADFAAAFNPPAYTYQDIQKKLGENEVAIEMIKGQRTNWEKEKPDTTFYYLALVLTKDDLFPVLMDKGREMDSLHFIEHRRSIGAGTGNYGYAIYWEKIAQAIEKHTQNKIAKVYLAPDGVYHQINLYTLLNPHTQRFLIEDYDLTILTNLKEILESPKQENTTKTAFLLGRPKYLLSKSQHEQVLASLDSQRGKDTETSNIKSAVETAWGELIGTEKEVKFIDSLFHQNQWQTQTYLAEQAVEERVKRVQNPTILHLATHGYFHKTSGRNSQQGMLNSGIVLAGVNTQDKDGSKEDGVLTALEASNLSLDQTELVVLSACETGLGEVAIGEGVYGLQRGFKVAGARSIIMSLWRVNDFVTQKIMQLFYQLWLSGKTKQQAFKEAQKKMKSEYDSPYLWGAFVMVGN